MSKTLDCAVADWRRHAWQVRCGLWWHRAPSARRTCVCNVGIYGWANIRIVLQSVDCCCCQRAPTPISKFVNTLLMWLHRIYTYIYIVPTCNTNTNTKRDWIYNVNFWGFGLCKSSWNQEQFNTRTRSKSTYIYVYENQVNRRKKEVTNQITSSIRPQMYNLFIVR